LSSSFGDKITKNVLLRSYINFTFPSFYLKPVNAHGRCRYKTLDGQVCEEFPIAFQIISRSNHYIEYTARQRNRVDFISLIARSQGFRTEIFGEENTFLIKIYGNTQTQLNNFKRLYLDNKFYFYNKKKKKFNFYKSSNQSLQKISR